MFDFFKIICVIKSGGDLASGVATSLFKAGFTVIMLEIENPMAVRRTVAFSSAISEGFIEIEGVMGKKTELNEIIHRVGNEKFDFIPVITDEKWQTIGRIRPFATIDAIVNKQNHGTKIDEAPFVIALGPGFTAKKDCHAVIETNRGHNLGRIIYEGTAETNTGRPGDIAGYTYERVVRTDVAGIFRTEYKIGDKIKKGDLFGHVSLKPFKAQIDGVVRGILPDRTIVKYYTKLGDIDPRNDACYCYTISDKSRAIGRAVLEAILIKLKTYAPAGL